MQNGESLKNVNLTGANAVDPHRCTAESPIPFGRYAKLIAVLALALALCFALPLLHLVEFAIQSDLYSYVLIVPFVSVYLAWLKKDELAKMTFRPALIPAVGTLGTGMILLAVYGAHGALHWNWFQQDVLCVAALSFVCLFLSGTIFLTGRNALRLIPFPLAFLFLMAPLPSFVEAAVENFLQHVSASAAYGMLRLAGMPLLQDGTTFKMPGLSINVAPECSGIHSSLVLLITALVAGHLFFRRNWTRLFFVLCVIPLGVLRNGFRIFTLCELSVYVDPYFIDSPLHHRGGPIFFLISLVPFFLLLWYLRELDRRKSPEGL